MLNNQPNQEFTVFSSIAVLAISGFILITSGIFNYDSVRLVAAVVAGGDNAAKAEPRTFYIDASLGNDSNTGLSPSQSWKTIAKVNNSKFNPGDQILFKRGETWREQLTVPSSGSADYPIVFDAYGTGPKPIITGADTVTGWTKHKDNIYVMNDN